MTENIEKQRNQPRIFISYARADDEPFVKQLYQDLIECGFDIWWDRKAMDSRGLTFLQEIRDAIEGSDRLIAVIGPNAVKSEYVKVEWEHGLLFAKTVIPILRLGNFDLIPQEIPKVHCPDFRKERTYKDALDELVRILKKPVPPLGTLHTLVPSLPAHFQSRRDEITRIGEAVLADIQRPTVVTSAKQTTAIVGMGGSGKSVLAAAFARATDTRRAFTDGIFWLQIGQNPDILSNLRFIGLGFNDKPENYADMERAKASLPQVLGNKVCLIVLDDIWNVNHVAPFKDALGSRCRLLITTRDGGLVTALGAQQHLLGMLTDSGSMRFLADWCEKDVSSLPAEAAFVAKECGYLPFALAICGAMARDGSLWSDMLDALNDADLAFIEKQFPNYPYTSVLKSVKISIDMLASEDLDSMKHYQELVVFHNSKSIPEAAIITLWMHTDGLKERNARKLLSTLNSKALLRLEGESPNRFVTLHDLQHDYLRATTGNLKNLHEKLLAAYQQKCKDGWAGGPNDSYFFENLAYHLVEARRKEELQKLLFDFGWIWGKLEATDINSLIKDYDFLPDDRNLQLVQGALQLSAHVLARDKTQLSGQLMGRLLSLEAPSIRAMLSQASEWKGTPWLRPLTASLMPPGGLLKNTLVGHTQSVSAVVITADGKHAISASNDHTLKIWDLEHDAEQLTISGHTEDVRGVAMTPDGRYIVSAAGSGGIPPSDNTLRIWDIDSGKKLLELHGHTREINAVAVTPDGRHIVSASGSHNPFAKPDNTIKIWDLKTGAELSSLKGHQEPINAIAVTPDGHRAISASGASLRWSMEKDVIKKFRYLANNRDGTVSPQPAIPDFTVKVWDLDTGREIRTLCGHTEAVFGVAISPDGRRAISASADNTIKVWDLDMGREIRTFRGHTGTVRAIVITPDGRLLISASKDKTLKIWDLDCGAELCTLIGHAGGVNAVAVTPDGRLAISASDDKTLKTWDISTVSQASLECKTNFSTSRGHRAQVDSVVMTPDGKRAISASCDNTIKVWDMNTEEEMYTLPCPYRSATPLFFMAGDSDSQLFRQESIISENLKNPGVPVAISSAPVAVTPNGNYILFGSKNLKLCNIHTRQELHTMSGHSDSVLALTITPDGHYAISASEDHTLKIWDLDTGAELHILRGHTGPVSTIAVTPDGLHAISGGFDKTLRFWDLEHGINLFSLVGHRNIVVTVFVTPDGKRAISVSGDGNLRIWDLFNGKELRSLYLCSPLHNQIISAVALTLDGRFSISCSVPSNILKVWDLEKGTLLRELKGFSGTVWNLVIMPDNQHIISTDDKILKIWNFHSGKLITSFSADDYIGSCNISPDGRTIVLGELSGRVHFLRMSNMHVSIEESGSGSPHVISTPGTMQQYREVLKVAKTRIVTCPKCGAISAQKPITKTITVIILLLLILAVIPLFYSLWWLPLSILIGYLIVSGIKLLLSGESYICPVCKKSFLVRDCDRAHAPLVDLIPRPSIITIWRSLGDAGYAFGCPHCRNWSKVPSSAIGTKMPCSNCGKTIRFNPFTLNADWQPVAKAWSEGKDQR